MIRIILVLYLFVFINSTLIAQAEFVEVDNLVYQFLDRMYADRFIDDYNSFEKPLTRKKIGDLLKQVQSRIIELSLMDRETLEDLLGEYCFDTTGELTCYESLISTPNVEIPKYNFFDDNEKYLFFYNKKDTFNIFVNLITGLSIISSRDNKNNYFATLASYGGEIRGTFLNRLGFQLYGDNGVAFGDKEVGMSLGFLKHNYKFNEKEEEKFFDKTSGYLNLDFDVVRFKIGNDTRRIGYGNLFPIINDPYVRQSYFDINLNYAFFNFTFSHSKLSGPMSVISDSVAGNINQIEDKYLAYHRIGFRINEHLSFGLGEMIIYSARGMDLSYMNPLSFYKTLEHQNGDRDNALLFIDLENRSIKGIRFFGTYMIDDLNYGKIGTKWWGNQSMLHAGIHFYLLNKHIPMDLEFEYLRVSPYTYTHRINRNNYSNGEFGINGDVAPNSELLFFKINYRFTPRISLNMEFRYLEHGANYYSADNGELVNVGGDLDLGHRTGDSEESVFLSGFKEYSREFCAKLNYEPIRNVTLSGELFFSSGNYDILGRDDNSYILGTITIKI